MLDDPSSTAAALTEAHTTASALLCTLTAEDASPEDASTAAEVQDLVDALEGAKQRKAQAEEE